jgi:hypothetical protein
MKKHLKFIINGKISDVYNIDGDCLGYIDYYIPWKCYVWNSYTDTIMSLSCLLELTEYMKNLKHKKD